MTSPGRVVPRGWRLPGALLAGALWVLALWVVIGVPAQVRTARLSEQRSGEGVVWVGVGMLLVEVGVLLSAASLLSAEAHGARQDAPGPVRRVRQVTWAVYGVLWIAVLVVGGWPDACFRTCAPFPR